MKKLLGYLRDYKKEAVLAPLFKLMEALLDLLVPLIMADIVDAGVETGDTRYILTRCALLIALGAVGLGFSITAQYFAARAAVGGAANLRSALFGHIQSLGFSELDGVGTSTLVTRMTSDITQVQNGLNLFLRLFLRSPFIVFGSVAMAFLIDVKVAVVFAVAVPLLAAVVVGVMLRTMPLYRRSQEGLDELVGLTRENLAGVRVVRAFNRQQDEERRFKQADARLNRLQLFAGRISALMNPLTLVIVNIGIIAILNSGGARVSDGALGRGEVIALVNYMTQILVELVKLANLVVQVSKAAAGAGRIEAALAIKPKMTFLNREPVSRQPESGCAVRFSGVSVRYDGAGGCSLTDVSFDAARGETIGVTGGTGSGKTTLVQLIPRWYDATVGEVEVLGRPVKEYAKGELTRKTAFVMQKTRLFSGTIRSNLCWGRADADDAELWAALETAQAADFVRSRDGGLDAPVEQNGRNLSGGQRQRLAIARALLVKPEILILDDSLSALDAATDAALRAALKKDTGGMTVFMVSQRVSALAGADRILVLDEGALAGFGTHGQLLESCGVYREIWQSQRGNENGK